MKKIHYIFLFLFILFIVLLVSFSLSGYSSIALILAPLVFISCLICVFLILFYFKGD